MRALLAAVVGLAALASTGCGDSDEGGADAGTDARIDAAPALDAALDAGPIACATPSDCPSGQVCLGGMCQPDPCDAEDPCTGSDRCRAVCVDLVDPCRGVACGPEETCVRGTCFSGCLPSACEGRTCPTGQFCDPSTGACTPIEPCAGTCGDSAACHLTCTPRSPCEGVTCGVGEFCRDGICRPNPCHGADCPSGSVCQNGECVETCNCDPACEAPERCIANRCVCVPDCPLDGTCGAPDGCGGFCLADCASASDACDPETGTCECVTTCAADAACGDPDGCGGRCDAPCAGGRSCVDGTCECVDTCLEPEDVACGEPVPPPCTGGMSCSGVGTRCEPGSTCIDGSCCPECASRATVACGMPVPDPVDGMGRTCRDCPDHGIVCPAGQGCILPPGATMDSERVCCGTCPAASSVPCGMDIPDVLDAMGNVCRICTGAGTGCAPDETCTGGATPMCCATCMLAADVACGTPIPDTSCQTCPGYGRACTDLTESCVLPPGGSADSSRRCCDACADAATHACGTDVPDRFASDGSLCRDCGSGTMCPAGSSCIGGACCPACADASAVACGMPVPDAVDSLGRVCRDCGIGTMCSAGETCAGSRCCPTCPTPSSFACGLDPSEPSGCPDCPDGTGCTGMGEICTGSPPACECGPSCAGRRCGESDGCGAECLGACDPGFACVEQPLPSPPGDYECEANVCMPTCGLCESCVLGSCVPLTCGAGETACLATCECCAPGDSCTATGCRGFG